MVGRILIRPRGDFEIHFDLLNAASLRFEDEHKVGSPYVPAPFPAMPGGVPKDAGPEVRMRAPTFWAALNLAGEREDGTRPSVLISLPQNVESFAKDALKLLESWRSQALPPYRISGEQDERWMRCVAAAADYLTEESTEYRLLLHGIAVHHGKMPALLARRLKQVIDAGIIRVVIATSTLSEGVNLPVTYVLLPSVYRGTHRLSLQEFTNLIGRAGRPGTGTEGQALVVLHHTTAGERLGRQALGYRDLVTALSVSAGSDQIDTVGDAATSPLAQLLRAVEEAWVGLTGGGSRREFVDWLERTAAVAEGENEPAWVRRLDALDGLLLSGLQEREEIGQSEVPADEVEEVLTRIWRRTYAFAAALEEERLREIWLARGRTLKSRYPDPTLRRDIYRTSLTPRSSLSLM